MNLAWTTLVIAALLSPGLLFFLGMYAPERFSRDIGPRSPYIQLSAVILISLFTHLVLISLINHVLGRVSWVPTVNLDYVLALLQLQGSDKYPLSLLAANINDNLLPIGIYMVSSGGIGYLTGNILSRNIPERTYLRGLVQHRWALDLCATKGYVTLIRAYVVSRIQNNNRHMIYSGVLVELFLAKDGSIQYLVLTEASRNFVNFSYDTTRGIKKLDNGNNGSDKQFLVIDGKDIHNFYFEIFRFPDSVMNALAAITSHSRTESEARD